MRTTLIAILAVGAMAMPIAVRQLPGLGSATSPVTTVLSEVGKQAPGALDKVEDAMSSLKKNTTRNGDSSSGGGLSGLGGLEGLVGGLTGGLGGL